MIVPRGARHFPNQAPLLGMSFPTVEGRLFLGGSRRTPNAGIGLLLPIDPTVPIPGTSGLAHKIPVRGVGLSRGLGRRRRGMGDVSYCDYNPPSASQVAYLQQNNIPYSIVKCAAGATTNPALSVQVSTDPIVAGPQPVQNLPPPPQYADCNPGILGEAGSTACAAANNALEVDWENRRGQAEADYNREMCMWNAAQNGQDGTTYCNAVYPPGYAGSGSPTTTPVPPPSAPLPPVPAVAQPAAVAPPATPAAVPPATSAPPATGVPSNAAASAPGVAPVSSFNVGGFDLSQIPTWAWIAVAGVGALMIFGGHK